MADGNHTFHTGEQAFFAFQNVAVQIDELVIRVAVDFARLEAIESGKLADIDGALAYLREVITEHLREQYPESLNASREHFEQDPLKIQQMRSAA